MSLLDLPLCLLESPTLLISRTVCGDVKTLDLGERFLSEERQEAIADRNPNQVGAMLEAQMRLDDR